MYCRAEYLNQLTAMLVFTMETLQVFLGIEAPPHGFEGMAWDSVSTASRLAPRI